MNAELRDLYQEVILDHNRSPRNHCGLAAATHKAEGFNPLCGDKVTVYLQVEDGVVKSVTFEGSGCAISTASASLMTESLKNRPVKEVLELFDSVHGLLTGKEDEPANASRLGKLKVFSGVREFPMRVKCASLPWHTVRAALEREQETATTE